MRICIITPCYNEGQIVTQLLKKLEEVLAALPHSFEVAVVNDGSTDDTLNLLKRFSFESSHVTYRVLNLPINIGHQKAIKQGLLYAHATDAERVIIMDSDGEDNPEAIVNLLAHEAREVIHVVRGRRNERLSFRLAYTVYKGIFFLITGKKMNFGNFCMIDAKALARILDHPYVHFAAFLQNQKLSRGYIVSDREKRIDGKSKMNFEKLVYHAFMSLVENAQSILMLFFNIFILLIIGLLMMLGFILYHKLCTGKAILGWASTISIGLLNLALVSFGFFMLGLLLLNLLKRQPNIPEKPLYQVIDI